MLDPRRLVVLREVAAHQSVSAAASALGYTPSAISQQIAALERETGVDLLERAGRGIRLTDAARTLLPHTHAVLAAIERAETALANAAHEAAGPVRLASFATVMRALLPAVLEAVQRRCPGLRLEVRELEPHESLPALALGHVDIAVAHEYDLQARHPAREFERRDLLREPVLLASRAPTPHQPTQLATLADSDWVLPPPDTACGDFVRRACQAAGFEPRGVAQTTDFSVMCVLAAAGLGVALIPQLGTWPADGLTLRQLTPPLHRRSFVAARTGLVDHPLVRIVIEAFHTAAAQQFAPPTQPINLESRRTAPGSCPAPSIQPVNQPRS